jgi:hypothetical protein
VSIADCRLPIGAFIQRLSIVALGHSIGAMAQWLNAAILNAPMRDRQSLNESLNRQSAIINGRRSQALAGFGD